VSQRATGELHDTYILISGKVNEEKILSQGREQWTRVYLLGGEFKQMVHFVVRIVYLSLGGTNKSLQNF